MWTAVAVQANVLWVRFLQSSDARKQLTEPGRALMSVQAERGNAIGECVTQLCKAYNAD